jgi:molecular chaperone DnaJ
MAVDFYALLGVARTASAAEVERAYRRLVRRYHPGVNPGDRVAERRYAEVQDAYLVLGDEHRRRDYDRGVLSGASEAGPVAFEGFDFSAVTEGPLAATFTELFADVFQHAAREATHPTRGQDVSVTMHLPFEDAVRGCQLPLSVSRQERCGACRGHGFFARAVAACAACGGEGTRRWARGHMVFSKTCESCGGDGHSVREPCRSCHGNGVSPRTEVVTLSVPPGLESGSVVSVPGRGHAGAQGGPAGDLYVTIEVGAHRHLTRHGADLYLTVPVGIHEAAFGTDIDLVVLDGPLSLRVPAGTVSGTRLTLKGRGGVMSGGRERGDLIVTLQIVLPARLDERSAELLREFGRLNHDDVRRDLHDGR